MLGKGIIPVCMLCGQPAKQIMSDRSSSFCSFRCRMIGNRNRQILLLIFLLVGVIISSVTANSNGDRVLTIVLASLTPVPILGFLLSRILNKRSKQSNYMKIPKSKPQDSILCVHCGKFNPSEYIECLYCRKSLSTKSDSSYTSISQNRNKL